MTDKLAKRFEENKQVAERGISDAVATAHETQQQQNAWMTMGGIMVVNHIAQALNAQTIRGIQRIRDEELYKPLGFSRFDDFLDEWNESPMTYKKFNEQEKLLMREGDALFDVLSSVKLSMRQRRLLGAGNIQIDGDNLIIKSIVAEGAAEKTEQIALSDRTRILQILSAVTDQNFLLNDKNNKQKEKIERGEREIEILKKKIDSGFGNGANSSIEFDGFMKIVTSTDALAIKVKKEFTLVEREAHSEVYLDGIFAAFLRLRSAYGRTDLAFSTQSAANPDRIPLADMSENEFQSHVAKKMKGYKGEDDENEFAELTADLNDEELEELMD